MPSVQGSGYAGTLTELGIVSAGKGKFTSAITIHTEAGNGTMSTASMLLDNKSCQEYMTHKMLTIGQIDQVVGMISTAHASWYDVMTFMIIGMGSGAWCRLYDAHIAPEVAVRLRYLIYKHADGSNKLLERVDLAGSRLALICMPREVLMLIRCALCSEWFIRPLLKEHLEHYHYRDVPNLDAVLEAWKQCQVYEDRELS